MNPEKTNRLLYETLSNLAPIATSKVSMFDIGNKYCHVPFFRFRFKNKSKNDEIYKEMYSTIERFEGSLTWRLVTKFESENFLILPTIYEVEEYGSVWNDKEYFITLYGESSYCEKIDMCINDIPKLAALLSKL